MRTGHCRCKRRIYFANHLCLQCGAELGLCEHCGALTSFQTGEGETTCDHCEQPVYACVNQQYQVCRTFTMAAESLCCWCEFTEAIPSTENPKHMARWARLELAKRQLLIQLEQLGLPPFRANLQQDYPLRFAFLADEQSPTGEKQKVMTGHQEGLITINLAEADSVHRERVRVNLREPQRTLIGHMRHEVGHYFDWAWASRFALPEYIRLFGDPSAVDYQQALDKHYEQGPPADWAESYVSAYATMHPWEDFAETVNAYLDLMALATTAVEQHRLQLDLSAQGKMDKIVKAVLELVVEVSQYNFDLGLQPLLPEQLAAPVVKKLQYVHRLRSINEGS